MTTDRPNDLPAGTRVLHAADDEPGTIVSGYARDRYGEGDWTQYEVQTRGGTEYWKVGEFVLADETQR